MKHRRPRRRAARLAEAGDPAAAPDSGGRHGRDASALAGPGESPAAVLARRALQRAEAALEAGRLARAGRLVRLAEGLCRVAREPAAQASLDLDEEEALRAELLDRLAARARALGLDRRDGPDGGPG